MGECEKSGTRIADSSWMEFATQKKLGKQVRKKKWLKKW